MIDWLEKAEEAVLKLADTDQQIAILKYKYECDKYNAKQEWSKLFLRATGPKGERLTVEERKAIAETHEDHLSAKRAEMTSLREFERLKNERESMKHVIDFWRSYQKAVNEGHV